MARFIDRTGKVYRTLVITKELGGGKVECTCNVCGKTNIYSKPNVVREAVKCECQPREREVRVDLTGKVFGSLTVERELGKNRVECRCNICGKTKVYYKYYVKKGHSTCGCQPKIRKDLTGKIFGYLKVKRELGDGKVLCKCSRCGYEGIYNKYELQRVNTKCRKCGRIIDRTGEVFRCLEIIEELGQSRVICKCLECGHLGEYNKGGVVAEKALCVKCGAPKGFTKIVGEQYGTLLVTDDLGNEFIKCVCQDCKKADTYRKSNLMAKGTSCTCQLRRRIRGVVIKNITVQKAAYTGRNGKKYYYCKCNNCGSELLLNRDEMLKYECGMEC